MKEKQFGNKFRKTKNVYEISEQCQQVKTFIHFTKVSKVSLEFI